MSDIKEIDLTISKSMQDILDTIAASKEYCNSLVGIPLEYFGGIKKPQLHEKGLNQINMKGLT